MISRIGIYATAAVLAAVVLLMGCGQSGLQQAAPAGPSQSYTLRGRVVGVPSAARPFDDLEIHHEAIPDYANRDGEVYVSSKGVRGMSSMVMGFPVAQGVSLEGIAPGDPVEFTFVVTWGEDYPSYEVTKIAKLPSDTELQLGGRE